MSPKQREAAVDALAELLAGLLIADTEPPSYPPPPAAEPRGDVPAGA
jgi:hypothetical protein